jgi:4-methyl-5(b-hydroxyethyl)-thiazole monophosphate biosynthesis
MEAVTIIDILRRGGIEVLTAGLEDGPVTGSRGTRLLPDALLVDVLDETFDMIVLPGGIPGADHLAENQGLRDLLRRHEAAGSCLAAVCAAPKALVRSGVLEGKLATAYPGVLEAEKHARISNEAVVIDGQIVTSRAAGTAMEFALTLVELLAGTGRRETVERGLHRA